MLNLPNAPNGFQGLHPDKGLEVYVRNLPHWRQDGATYFVTYRLADSLPQPQIQMLYRLRDRLSRGEKLTSESRALIEKHVFQKTEEFLDRGYGACELADASAAGIVRDSLTHFDGDRLEVGAMIIMPNHVHVIIRPIEYKLEELLYSIKRYSATAINRRIGRSGLLWQAESYDRIIRDDDHLWRCLQYIGRNGRIAGVNALRWVNPTWEKIGWKFHDDD